MSTGTTKSPNLPIAPVEYDQRFMDQLTNVLRLYFAQLDNAGPSSMATQRNGTAVVSALNFSQRLNGAQVYSLPTQADLLNLRVGDVYLETSSNVLKVVTGPYIQPATGTLFLTGVAPIAVVGLEITTGTIALAGIAPTVV